MEKKKDIYDIVGQNIKKYRNLKGWTQKELADIKNKINKLQDTNLDSDLLDEEIRKNTGYIKQNEIVIYTDVFNQE